MEINKNNTMSNNTNPFKVTIETMTSEYAETESTIITSDEFPTKKEANKFKRSMMKAHELINHGGHIVNYSKHLELFTNF